MPSFREIVALHEPVLLLDTGNAQVQMGWFNANGAPHWAASRDEAGVGLFQAIEQLGVSPGQARSFVLCSGPGSVLGIRTAAMAVRAWNAMAPRPVFSYHGLAVVAHALNRPEATIIADARRESWHAYAIGKPLRRIATADLSGPLVMPEGFRTWSTVPPEVTAVPYSMAELLPKVIDEQGLFNIADAPDAFLHEAPNYATWTPQIHRAPVS